MALARVSSWITNKFKIKTKNEITPVEIIVQPRHQEQSPERDPQEQRNFSVFAIDDEPKYARLWYSNDSRHVSAAAVLGDDGLSENNGTQIIEMTEVGHFGPPLKERSELTSDYSNGNSNNFRLLHHSPPAQSAHHLSVPNCFQKTLSCLAYATRARSKPKRIRQSQNYISSYLGIMHLFCVSGVRTYENQQNDVKGLQKLLCWIALKLQLIFFILFAFLSVFQSFCQAKYDILWFLFKGGLNQFVKFSFNVTSLVTSGYFSYILSHEWEAVKTMIHVMRSYQLNVASAVKYPAFCLALAIITVLLASFRSLFIIDIKGFSVEDAMLESAYQMSEDLYLWSARNLNLSTQKLIENFENDLNSVEILLAVVKIVRDFAYYLQDGMLWDFIGCVVLTLFYWMQFFMKFVSEVVENVLDEASVECEALQQQREIVWRMYRETRNVFEAVNNVFDSLLLLFHASNVLRYAFFVENLIYPGDVNTLTYVHLLYNILKSEVTYIMASRIAQKNKVIRKWLRNWGSTTGKVDVGYTKIDLTAVLDELDEEPLGLGKGELMINQKFHFGLLGLVSSLFVMLASKKQ